KTSSFQIKNSNGTQASLPAARQASVSAPAMHAGSVRVPVMVAEPIPVALRLSMMDEQTPQGNHPRPFAALHQSNARPSALALPEFLEYLQPALRRDEFLAHVSPKTLKSANRPRLLRSEEH